MWIATNPNHVTWRLLKRTNALLGIQTSLVPSRLNNGLNPYTYFFLIEIQNNSDEIDRFLILKILLIADKNTFVAK